MPFFQKTCPKKRTHASNVQEQTLAIIELIKTFQYLFN